MKLFELKKIQTEFPKNKVTCSSDAHKVISLFYGDDLEVFESMFILLLNRANHTIGYAKISQGGISGTVVDIRLIAKYAIESLASGVILCHNHPSGTLRPSNADIDITKKVKESLKLFDISLLDHQILTSSGYYSFADEGAL